MQSRCGSLDIYVWTVVIATVSDLGKFAKLLVRKPAVMATSERFCFVVPEMLNVKLAS